MALRDGAGLATLLKEYGETHGLSPEQVITEIADEIEEHGTGEAGTEAPLDEIDVYLSLAYSSLEEALESMEEVARLRTGLPHEMGGVYVVVPEEIRSLLERIRAEIEALN